MVITSTGDAGKDAAAFQRAKEVESVLRSAHAGEESLKDTSRAAAFYCEVAELKTLRVLPDHITVGSPAFQLVVHEIPQHIADSCSIEDPPRRREETPIKLSFPVKSIAAARAATSRLGGRLDSPEREWKWEGEGRRVCDGVDPEGNVFQVSEVAR